MVDRILLYGRPGPSHCSRMLCSPIGPPKTDPKITFTKKLSNAKYTLIATGWDETNGQVITGLIGGILGSATHWNAAHCYITFYPTNVDLEDTDTLWSWAIYGAKFKE